MKQDRALILCCGNTLREDDGIGPQIGSLIEKQTGRWDVHICHQLNIEDVQLMPEYSLVIFVDAAVTGKKNFLFRKTGKYKVPGFSSHSMTPNGLADLAQELFKKRPNAYTLSVRGYSFSMFTENCTANAYRNIQEATAFLLQFLQQKGYADALGE